MLFFFQILHDSWRGTTSSNCIPQCVWIVRRLIVQTPCLWFLCIFPFDVEYWIYEFETRQVFITFIKLTMFFFLAIWSNSKHVELAERKQIAGVKEIIPYGNIWWVHVTISNFSEKFVHKNSQDIMASDGKAQTGTVYNTICSKRVLARRIP